MPVSLDILQFGKLLTLMTLFVRFSRGPRLSRSEHWVIFAWRMSLTDQTQTARKSHVMAVVCNNKCKTTAWMAFRCVPAVLKHLKWRTLHSHSHLPCLSRALDALQAAGQCFLLWLWLHIGRNCFLAIFKMRLLYKAAQWCLWHVSFLLEISQDLKQHALVNYLVASWTESSSKAIQNFYFYSLQ